MTTPRTRKSGMSSVHAGCDGNDGRVVVSVRGIIVGVGAV